MSKKDDYEDDLNTSSNDHPRVATHWRWWQILRQLTIAICLYLSFSAVFKLWSTFDTVMALMEEKGIMSKTEGPILLGIGLLSYVVGKLLFGLITHHVGGVIIINISLVVQIAAALVFTFVPYSIARAIAWVFIKLGMASIFPGLTDIIPRWYQPKHYGIVTGIVTSAYDTIEVITSLISGFVIREWDPEFGIWRILMLLSILFMGMVVFLNFFFLRTNPPKRTNMQPSQSLDELDGVESENSVVYTDDLIEMAGQCITERTNGFVRREIEKEEVREHDMDNRSLVYVIRKTITSLQFWAIFFAVAGMVIIQESIHYNRMVLLKIGFDSDVVLWIMSGCYMASIIMNIGSGLIYKFVNVYFQAVIMVGCMLLTVMGLLVLSVSLLLIKYFNDLNFPPYFVIGSFILVQGMYIPPYYIVLSLFSMEFGGKERSALIISLIDCGTFLIGSIFHFSTIQIIGSGDYVYLSIYYGIVLLIAIMATLCLGFYYVLDVFHRWDAKRPKNTNKTPSLYDIDHHIDDEVIKNNRKKRKQSFIVPAESIDEPSVYYHQQTTNLASEESPLIDQEGHML